MKPLACRYSIIRFVPFVETGEFANVGIVLVCPQTNYFSFALQDRRTKRITDFFEGIEKTHYKNALKAIECELGRIRTTLLRAGEHGDADFVRCAFTALTQPREAIIRFSQPRVLLTVDPAKTLQDKFDHYVDHSFVTTEYVEKTMNTRLKDLLSKLSLVAPFKPARIGSDVVSAQFDFVQKVDDEPQKVIKALNLTHKDTNDMATHGDVWIGKISRLKRHQEIPDDILFNVALPDPKEVKRYGIGMEILRDLERQNVIVVPGHDGAAIRRIREFAQA